MSCLILAQLSAMSLALVVAACAEAAGVDPDVTWVDEAFLGASGVMYPMPPYWPAAMAADGFMRASATNALAVASVQNR